MLTRRLSGGSVPAVRAVWEGGAAVDRALARVARAGREARLRQARQALLAANGGTALGSEAQQAAGERYVLILADASPPGQYRYSAGDARGFFPPSPHVTAAAAREEASRDGYTVPAPGALARLCQALPWAAPSRTRPP